MQLYISSSLIEEKEREAVLSIADEYPGTGIEIFPHPHDPEYFPFLDSIIKRLRNIPICFHGPYFETEHSAPNGSEEYKNAMEYFHKTMEYAKQLNAAHIVYHLNNCVVEPEIKEKMQKNGEENLRELADQYAASGTEILVENTGVPKNRNVLLNQQEFIDYFRESPEDCLFDIGHAQCGVWDMEEVIRQLKDKIKAYHLHNNDGISDQHKRILDGTIDMKQFLLWYKSYTPNAKLVLEYKPGSFTKEQLIEDIEFIRAGMSG